MPLFDDEALKRYALMAQMPGPPVPADESVQGPRGAGVGPYAAAAVGQAADVISTKRAFDRGAKEGNPLFRGMSLGQIAAVKAGTTAGLMLAMRQIAKTHPRVAKWLGYGAGTAGAIAALHNRRVMK